MRWIVSSLLCLLLSACFSSETPQIPETTLSRPADFAGSFWWVSQIEKLEAKVVEVRPVEAGGLSITDKDPVHMRLVELLGARLYLLISDEEGNRSSYFLLQRREDGIWEMDNISVAAGSPFADQNLDWLDKIARRHKLSLDTDSSDTAIEGNVHGMAIPALFRDTAWLAALEVRPMGFYLPMRAQPVSVAEIPLPTPDRTGRFLNFDGAPPVGKGIACPDNLGGTYLDRAYLGASSARVTVRRKSDCRFELERADGAMTLTLLPFDEEQHVYVGIEQWREDSGGWHGYMWFVRERDDEWTFSQITLQPPTMTEPLDALRTDAMKAAAIRHRLGLYEGSLSAMFVGASVEQVSALLHDAQFTSGLTEQHGPGRWLVPASSFAAPGAEEPES